MRPNNCSFADDTPLCLYHKCSDVSFVQSQTLFTGCLLTELAAVKHGQGWAALDTQSLCEMKLPSLWLVVADITCLCLSGWSSYLVGPVSSLGSRGCQPHHHHSHFTALFPGLPRWAGARREFLDFMVHGKTNIGRHTDHPAGCHSIWTNQCPPPPSPIPGAVKWDIKTTSQSVFGLCVKNHVSNIIMTCFDCLYQCNTSGAHCELWNLLCIKLTAALFSPAPALSPV